MIRLIQILLTIVVSSLFLFPVELPVTGFEINTKMVLAVIGSLLLVLDMVKNRDPLLSRDFIYLSIICAIISLWAFSSTLLNGSVDNTFATYIISVWVWLGAAYVIVWLINAVHGTVTAELIGNYLISVCVCQCILAYLMSLFPPLDSFIVNLMGGFKDVRLVGRLYGFGAALDPAGLRFSGVLVVLSWLIAKTDFSNERWKGLAYILSFFIISAIGNMIARTTTVGMIIGLVLWVIAFTKETNKTSPKAFWSSFLPIFVLFLVLVVWLYQVSPSFRVNIRFGFEGFFSLVEKGRWEVHSNDVLKGMIIWPESLRTWIMGDGFFVNPTDMPDRFGQTQVGYYMHTDIGYLRYIYYFGTIGLVLMMSVPIQMTISCCRNLPEFKWVFITLMMVTFIGWTKVSSDIIMVFAPFLILSFLKQEGNSLYLSSSADSGVC